MDESAFARLAEQYAARLYTVAFRLLGNRADAEEVAGDVFLVIVERRTVYDGMHKLATWLFAIARNKCVSRLRRRKPLLSLWVRSNEDEDGELRQIADARMLQSEELVNREVARAVQRAIERLPLEQREAIVLRQYHEFSYDKISLILGCAVEKVKILIYRAKQWMRMELAPLMKEQR